MKHKNFVPLSIANLECLLHLKDVNFECWVNNWHGYYSTQGNNHLNFIPWHHLVLVKDFRIVELGLIMNGLNNIIKRQGVCIWHHLGSLQKNSKCYICTMKTMKEIHNFANKRVPNAPNTSGVSIILVKNTSLQDMSCKSRHKKV
jgi:hypothetical protein